MNRIGALAYRIFRQFLRDRRTMVLIFVAPVVIMSLLAWVLKAESQPFRVTVLAGEEESVMMRELLRDILIKKTNVEIVEGTAVPLILEQFQLVARRQFFFRAG